MELKFLHIYDDIMNLYGEYANVAILSRYLTRMGHQVTVDSLSLYEVRDISGYDFYYMGAGTERKQKLALAQLLRYKDALHKACEDGRVILFTGNALPLLGSTVTDAEGKKYEALGIGTFETVESNRRITGDCLAYSEEMGGTLVGFMNKCSITTGIDTPLFTMEMGFGNEKTGGTEGFRRNHCIATHMTGPVLIKNPGMLSYMAHLLAGEQWKEIPMEPYMEQAYKTTVNALKQRLNEKKG